MCKPDSTPEPAVPLRILFVCTGNTCRSPLAEALARNLAAVSGFGPVEVRSAGTEAVSGLPASVGALGTARRHGLDLENHRSTPLSPELVVWADRVLAMGVGHLHRIQEMGGTEKGVLLVAFARGVDEEGDDLEVPDPYGGDDQVYEATYEDLRIQVGKAFARIRREAAK